MSNVQRCIHRPKALLAARLPLTEVTARRGGRASAAAACQPIEDDGATAGAEWHSIASGAAAAATAQEQTPTSIHIASPIGVLRGAVDVSQACTQEEKWQRRKVGEEPADRKLSTAGLAPVAALPARRLACCLPCNRQRQQHPGAHCQEAQGIAAQLPDTQVHHKWQHRKTDRSLCGTCSTVAPMPAPRSTVRDRLITSFSLRV